MKLGMVMIGSEDPSSLKRFYTSIFGEPGWDQEGFTGWMLGGAALMIGPHSEVKGRNEMPGRIIWNLETEDVRGEFERIKKLGATVVAEPYNPGFDDGNEGLLATFKDPEGNYFQLASPMPEDM